MRNNISKIDIDSIIKGYTKTFKAYRSAGYDRSSVLFFLIFPVFIGVSMPLLNIFINEAMATLLTAIYSIFSGLFFGFEVFIFEAVSKIVELKIGMQSSRLRLKKFEQISSNVLFSILICFAGFSVLIAVEIFRSNYILFSIFSGLSFYLFTLFVLTLLSILKGVNVLVSEEIEIQNAAIDEKFSGRIDSSSQQ